MKLNGTDRELNEQELLKAAGGTAWDLYDFLLEKGFDVKDLTPDKGIGLLEFLMEKCPEDVREEGLKKLLLHVDKEGNVLPGFER